MESTKGAQNLRHVLLPPKVPFPSVSASSTEYLPRASVGLKAVQRPREGNTRHQRTSSESYVMEEQPIWLDDLLNEPESPVGKPGHRRSSSDSFAFSDMADITDTGYAFQNNHRLRNMISVPLRGLTQEVDRRGTSFYPEANSLKPKNKPWASLGTQGAHPKFPFPPKENIARQNSGPSFISQEAKEISRSLLDKNPAEPIPRNPAKVLHEKENSNAKPAPPEHDTTKSCKQQFAQRSRVRKLQYIAELERNVQTLQAEGSEVSAELRFLNQQSLILSMENKSLKQQLESLAQEKLIKRLEQEVLERQIERLRALYQQQQKQQQEPPQLQKQLQKQPLKPSSNHRRRSSKDLDAEFSNLYLKSQDSSSAHDIIAAQVRS